MKKCSKCKEFKKESKFSKQLKTYDGLESSCKECHTKLIRTEDGLIKQIYRVQVATSKKRGHEKPHYTKEDLYEWVMSQDNFKFLYEKWKNNQYATDLKPSVDRLDDYKPYSLDNIQLITWKENNDNATKHTKPN
jgi:hypothetical protein